VLSSLETQIKSQCSDEPEKLFNLELNNTDNHAHNIHLDMECNLDMEWDLDIPPMTMLDLLLSQHLESLNILGITHLKLDLDLDQLDIIHQWELLIMKQLDMDRLDITHQWELLDLDLLDITHQWELLDMDQLDITHQWELLDQLDITHQLDMDLDLLHTMMTTSLMTMMISMMTILTSVPREVEDMTLMTTALETTGLDLIDIKYLVSNSTKLYVS